MELYAAYNDAAWQNKGVWQNIVARGFFDDVVVQQKTTLELELSRAAKSSAHAIAWVKANPAKLLPLGAMKVFSELRPASIVEWILLLLGCAGLFAAGDRRLMIVMLALLLINLSAVAVTWSVDGRFPVPQLLVFYVLAGAGAHVVAKRTRNYGVE